MPKLCKQSDQCGRFSLSSQQGGALGRTAPGQQHRITLCRGTGAKSTRRLAQVERHAQCSHCTQAVTERAIADRQ